MKKIPRQKIYRHVTKFFKIFLIILLLLILSYLILLIFKYRDSTKPETSNMKVIVEGYEGSMNVPIPSIIPSSISPNVPYWGFGVVKPLNVDSTYTNGAYNFQLTIPVGCAYLESTDENEVVVSPLEKNEIWEGDTYGRSGIYISVLKDIDTGKQPYSRFSFMDSEKDFSYWYDSGNPEIYDGNDEYWTKIVRTGKTKVSGEDAIVYKETNESLDGPAQSLGIWTRRHKINYFIELVTYGDDEADKYLEVYKNIISSFEFTN